MAEGLKPCPFCGRVDKLKIWATETPFDDMRLTNWHVSCSMAGDGTGCGGTGGARRTREEAIEAWNRRADRCFSGNG